MSRIIPGIYRKEQIDFRPRILNQPIIQIKPVTSQRYIQWLHEVKKDEYRKYLESLYLCHHKK